MTRQEAYLRAHFWLDRYLGPFPFRLDHMMEFVAGLSEPQGPFTSPYMRDKYRVIHLKAETLLDRRPLPAAAPGNTQDNALGTQ